MDDFATAWMERYERRVRKRHYPASKFTPPPFVNPACQPKVGGCESHARIVKLIKETQCLTGLRSTVGFKTRVIWRRTPDALRQWGKRHPEKFRARTEKWLSLLREHRVSSSHLDFEEEKKVRDNIAMLEEELKLAGKESVRKD